MVLHTLFVLCNLIPLALSPSLEGFSYDDGGEITSITRRSTQKKCLSLHCSEHFHIFYLFSLVKSIVYTNFTNEHNLCSNKVLFFSFFFLFLHNTSRTRNSFRARSSPNWKWTEEIFPTASEIFRERENGFGAELSRKLSLKARMFLERMWEREHCETTWRANLVNKQFHAGWNNNLFPL